LGPLADLRGLYHLISKMYQGGLNFDSDRMGAAYSIGGVSLFIYQMFIFPLVEQRLGILRTFQTGLLFSLPAFVIMPLSNNFIEQPVLMWMMIGLSHVLRACAGVQAFVAVFMMISNSITSEKQRIFEWYWSNTWISW